MLPYLKENSSIINTTSITAFDGKKNLIDYSATKGAITVFTKSLALSLADSKIRVNAVAPGPIWTLLFLHLLQKNRLKFLEQKPSKKSWPAF